MYNQWVSTADAKELLKTLEDLGKCNGDCRNCPYMRIDTAKTDRGIAYAYRCERTPVLGRLFTFYTNTTSELREETINGIKFELDIT